MRKLVMFKDYMGLPRAWASGPTQEAAEPVARRHLADYCAEKAAVGEVDLADPKAFTLEVVDIA